MKMCGGEAKRIDQDGNGGSYSREPCKEAAGLVFGYEFAGLGLEKERKI
jgi:hypothetical protein